MSETKNHSELKEQRSIKEYIRKLETYVAEQISKQSSDTREGLCEMVATLVKKFFDERGIPNKIIEGDLEIAQNDYLVHRVNLVYENDDLWVIDLSSKQIPWLAKSDWIFEKLPSDNQTLKQFLHHKYNWRFQEKQ